MNTNAIIGTVKGYDYYQLLPFIKTLKRTGFEGDIVFFVFDLSKKTIDRLRNHGIKLIFLRKTYPYLSLEEYPDKENILLANYKHNMHICSKRFLAYYLYLINQDFKYNSIMLSDVRDLVFQRNPFELDIGDRLMLFQESQKIEESSYNIEWIRKVYGENVLDELRKKEVICAGTTLGSYIRIIEYLKLMVKELVKGNAIFGDDQAIHNYIGYYGLVHSTIISNNISGAILTTAANTGEFTICEYGLIKNKSGRIVYAIHQYDRVPLLINKFYGLRLFAYMIRKKKIAFIREIFPIEKKELVKKRFPRLFSIAKCVLNKKRQ